MDGHIRGWFEHAGTVAEDEVRVRTLRLPFGGQLQGDTFGPPAGQIMENDSNAHLAAGWPALAVQFKPLPGATAPARSGR